MFAFGRTNAARHDDIAVVCSLGPLGVISKHQIQAAVQSLNLGIILAECVGIGLSKLPLDEQHSERVCVTDSGKSV